MYDTDKSDVVYLRRDIVNRMTGECGLELPRQVGVLRIADVAVDDLLNGRCGIDDLLSSNPGYRRAEDYPGAVAAGLGGVEADGLEATPDLGNVFDANAQHEVLIVQLPRLQGRGLAAIDAGSALGVEPVPPEATTKIIGIDGCEAALGVYVLDPGPDVERVVVLL